MARSSTLRILLAFVLCTPNPAWAARIQALAEWFRPDPFGAIVAPDRPGAHWLDRVQLKAARNGYASFQLVVKAELGATQIAIDFPLSVDVYREWFHPYLHDHQYYPDALIPIHLPASVNTPEPDHPIPGQVAQAYWVDIWIPADAEAKTYRGEARLSGNGPPQIIPIEITVLRAVIPEHDAVTLDNNSYGTSWLLDQYPKTLARVRAGQDGDAEMFRLIHEHHRIFYDHRGTFHQLGYGHGGKVGPEFAPAVTGSGREKHITSWVRFDAHYGPLLDGSAFRQSRRPARPIPFMYLPINPEWPASFLWWGEPGYEAEFVNVVSEMERHFRDKGWTNTQFEVFFNHKKRYKGFNWDGDEIRFERDNRNLIEYARLLRKAVSADSPVHFAMRADTSWSMQRQFSLLKGIVKFWVAGEGIYGWYPEATREVLARGDRVWTYGGTPAVDQVSTQIALNPLRSWITGVDGFVRWLTVSPGTDPWVHFEGGRETLIYPGEGFGVAGPLASIRLKLQRNCLQDLALLESAAKTGSREAVKEEVVRRFNGTSLAEWRNSQPALTARPVLEWNNADIDDAMKAFEARFAQLQPDAWLQVREYALGASK